MESNACENDKDVLRAVVENENAARFNYLDKACRDLLQCVMKVAKCYNRHKKGSDKLVEKNFDELSIPISERWENLTLANDFLFGKVMSDAELCTEMIKRILPDIYIGQLEFTQSQKAEKPSLDTRGVRFDLYAKSDNRKIFDCEVQTTDKKDLSHRTRAYHIVLRLEALETETLKKSGSYKDLPDTFVIFICTFDPFDGGRHI